MLNFPYQIVDLTHPLDETTPSWNGGCGFQSDIKMDYSECDRDIKFRVQQIKMHAGIGTHIDAPAHCIPGASTIDELQLSNLVAPCIVIDITLSAHERSRVEVKDIENFEQAYGTIKRGSFAMLRTGWERFWDDAEKYRNHHLFPSVSADAAKFLLDRGIVGLGIDTLSPDRPEDGFPVHQLLLGAGKYIVENAAHLDNLPPQGSLLLALPIKTKGGTEAPIRLISFIKQE